MFDYEVNTLQGLTYKMFQWQRFPVVPLFHKVITQMAGHVVQRYNSSKYQTWSTHNYRTCV